MNDKPTEISHFVSPFKDYKVTIDARVVADSIAPNGVRITSLLAVFPRLVLSEFNTHRMFSRNAASSRAIPITKWIKEIRQACKDKTLAMPAKLVYNEPGMQGFEEMTDHDKGQFITWWYVSAWEACNRAEKIIGEIQDGNPQGHYPHKQLINRTLEPYMYMTVLVTSTSWSNFTMLRAHEAADPTIGALGYAVIGALNGSTPNKLQWGDYHLPFTADDPRCVGLSIEDKLKVATARAARVSYTNQDRTDFDINKDFELHDRLIASGHMSPAEHSASAVEPFEGDCVDWGNFGTTWLQYRKTLSHECHKADPRLVNLWA